MSKLKYDESFPERAGEYAAQGLNNTRIARELGIAEDTFYVYLKQFPAFAEAVELGRRAVRDKVDDGMMDLAMGKCFVQTVKRSDNGHETKTIRQRAPDLNAIIRWLERNRHCAGDSWEDDVVQNADPVVLNIPANFKYDESFPEDAGFRAAAGETDLQIAGRLGISQASFYNYKKQFPDFASALERGRKECYIRLRRQLLALALGQCTIVTQSYRDGDFRKCTERQLPPNLKAIKYWLADSASREVRGQEAGGCPPVASGLYNGRMGETASAQRLSNSSECGESEKSGKREKQEKWKAGTNENDPVQRVSISSESGRAGKGNGKNWSNENNGDKTEKTDDMPAQSPSISSESDADGVTNLPPMRETSARLLSRMSRKERQRLLKNRMGNRSR